MSRKKKLSVLVIGCGNIAGYFENTKLKYPLTHAGAYKKNERNFRLSACLDIVKKKSIKFKKKWNFENAYSSFETLRKDFKRFDVISVCVPSNDHYDLLDVILEFKPLIVFCEKPLTMNLNDSQKIIQKYKSNKIPLAVNYTRRWCKDIIRLKTDLSKKKNGKIISITGQYNKGLFNNGSHMIDLFSYLFGKLRVRWTGKHQYDYWKDDPSISFILETKDNLNIMVNALDYSYYPLFEIQIYTEKSIIEMIDSGHQWIIRKINKRHINDKNKLKKIEGNINQSMDNSIKNIVKYLKKETSLRCSGDDALNTQRICHKIFEF